MQQNFRMPHQRTGLFPLKILFVVVFHLLLIHSCRGQSEVIGPSQPIVAHIGDDVTLPCHLDPAVDAAAMMLEWTKKDLKPQFVHMRRAGQDLTHSKNPSYTGRTSVYVDELKNGNISLKLSDVRPSDAGTYQCYMPGMDQRASVKLVVGAVSSPAIAGFDKSSGGVDLQCESEGWYPEPEVSWLDGEGNVLSAGRTETVRRPDGLYTVSSRVTVERHSNNFTCRVHQRNINQTRETLIYISDDFFEVKSSSAAPIIITVVVILAFCVFIFAVVFSVHKWRQKIIKIKRSHRDETEEDRESEMLRTDETVEMKSSWNPYTWFEDEHQRRDRAEKEGKSLKKKLKEEKKSREEERQQHQTELGNKKTELTEEKKRSEELQTELDNKKQEAENLKGEKKRNENEWKKLQEELENKMVHLLREHLQINLQTDDKKRIDLYKRQTRSENQLEMTAWLKQTGIHVDRLIAGVQKLKMEKQSSEEQLAKELKAEKAEVEKLKEEKKRNKNEWEKLQEVLEAEMKELQISLQTDYRKRFEPNKRLTRSEDQPEMTAEFKQTIIHVDHLIAGVKEKHVTEVKNLTEEKQKVDQQLEDKKQELTKEKQSRENERKDLQTQLDAKKKEVENLNKEKQTTEIIQQDLQKQLNTKTEQVNRLNQELVKKNQENEQLKEKNQELEKKYKKVVDSRDGGEEAGGGRGGDEGEETGGDGRGEAGGSQIQNRRQTAGRPHQQHSGGPTSLRSWKKS